MPSPSTSRPRVVLSAVSLALAACAPSRQQPAPPNPTAQSLPADESCGRSSEPLAAPAASQPGTALVRSYEDFGPQAMAEPLIGPAWYAWSKPGCFEPDDEFDVHVVVYEGDRAAIARAYPTIEHQIDYRLVPRSEALTYLDQGIAELQHEVDAPLTELRARLQSTRAKIVDALPAAASAAAANAKPDPGRWGRPKPGSVPKGASRAAASWLEALHQGQVDALVALSTPSLQVAARIEETTLAKACHQLDGSPAPATAAGRVLIDCFGSWVTVFSGRRTGDVDVAAESSRRRPVLAWKNERDCAVDSVELSLVQAQGRWKVSKVSIELSGCEDP